MTTAETLVYYPQYCFHLSPTINKWCPLRAADIAGLLGRPGFEGERGNPTLFNRRKEEGSAPSNLLMHRYRCIILSEPSYPMGANHRSRGCD